MSTSCGSGTPQFSKKNEFESEKRLDKIWEELPHWHFSSGLPLNCLFVFFFFDCSWCSKSYGDQRDVVQQGAAAGRKGNACAGHAVWVWYMIWECLGHALG